MSATSPASAVPTSLEASAESGTKVCSHCKTEPRNPGQAYGKMCNAAYQRMWRAQRQAEALQKKAELAREQFRAMFHVQHP